MTPSIFGCPLWYRCKPRVAKKYLHPFLKRRDVIAAFKNMDVGDLINDCSSFNHRIVKIEPRYKRARSYQSQHNVTGDILIDVDFTNELGGNCSLMHCGISRGQSREDIEASSLEFMRKWTLGDEGRHWYGERYPVVQERVLKMVALLESGGHIADENGMRLPEFDLML